MKKSFLMLAGLLPILMFSSCEKEEQVDSNTNVFTATMEPCTDQQSKTSLVGNQLRWDPNDEVALYGSNDYSILSATPQSNATTAVFRGRTEIGSAPYYAVYPSSIANGRDRVTLPAIQWRKDDFIRGFPMYTQSNDRTLSFRNLCGLIKLHLTKPNVSISSITFITEENVAVRGVFGVDYNGGNPRLTAVSANSNMVKMICSTAQSISNGADFIYICQLVIIKTSPLRYGLVTV